MADPEPEPVVAATTEAPPAPKVQRAAPTPAPTTNVAAEAAEPTVTPVEQGITPLDPDMAKIFLASVEDPPTDVRHGVTKKEVGKHYLAGNEKTLHAYYEHIKDVGGGYVGVGSDQAYLFLGWMKPDVAWLIDYDADVVAIHGVYKAFFEHAETPEEMIELWSEEQRLESAKLVADAYPGDHGKRLRRLFLANRGWINRRLKGVSRRIDTAGIPHWLGDQDTYTFVRDLLASGRVRPLVANLLDDEGVRGVGDAARKMGVEIRVLYLSNAEQYWPRYKDDFRANMAQLPFAEDAQILRTLLIWSVNEDYRYNIQPARNFLEWLAQPYTTNVNDITHKRAVADPEAINFFVTNEPPAASPAAQRFAESS